MASQMENKMRRRFTQNANPRLPNSAALKPRAKRYATPDPELRGHWIRVQPSGAKSYAAVTRGPQGKQIWKTIGAADAMSIGESREQARGILKRVQAGLPAVEAKGETFAAVAANWLKRHVAANKLRSRSEIERLLAAHVLPEWGDREFLSIRRSDVAALLDDVEDGHSARQADAVLTVVRSLMNWYATRSDGYAPPIVRGMRRQSPHATARTRILSDDELRPLWKAAESSGAFGAAVQVCLLTAQRRSKVLRMQWAELEGNAWTIPKEAREKDNAGVLVLPELARAIIAAQPRFAGNPHVFAGRGAGPINGISKCKARLDRAINITGWTLHDLRRTARSLMARAGVRPDIAERVMGHAIAGVAGVYDRHSYKAEKADAMTRLAALLDGIVHPRDNVAVMERPRRR
jgi:integrase